MNHDPKTGKFVKGNKASKGHSGDKEIKFMKTAIRKELVRCAYSLIGSWKTLEADTKKEGVSRYQHLINKAVSKGDFKLITWITEMVIGKPKNIENEDDNENRFFVPVTKEQQEELVAMAMRAREKKELEEKRQIDIGE